jgi:hypothetical protein
MCSIWSYSLSFCPTFYISVHLNNNLFPFYVSLIWLWVFIAIFKWLLRATFGKKKNQFYWWKKSEYTVKITELSQATDILYYLNLYLVHLELTNNSDVKRWLYRYKCIWICKPSYHAILGTMMVWSKRKNFHCHFLRYHLQLSWKESRM